MALKLKKGWLNDQYAKAWADVQSWPEWMRREAGLLRPSKTPAADTAPKTGDSRPATGDAAKSAESH